MVVVVEGASHSSLSPGCLEAKGAPFQTYTPVGQE